jgi:hypothetical protein
VQRARITALENRLLGFHHLTRAVRRELFAPSLLVRARLRSPTLHVSCTSIVSAQMCLDDLLTYSLCALCTASQWLYMTISSDSTLQKLNDESVSQFDIAQSLELGKIREHLRHAFLMAQKLLRTGDAKAARQMLTPRLQEAFAHVYSSYAANGLSFRYEEDGTQLELDDVILDRAFPRDFMVRCPRPARERSVRIRRLCHSRTHARLPGYTGRDAGHAAQGAPRGVPHGIERRRCQGGVRVTGERRGQRGQPPVALPGDGRRDAEHA